MATEQAASAGPARKPTVLWIALLAVIVAASLGGWAIARRFEAANARMDGIQQALGAIKVQQERLSSDIRAALGTAQQVRAEADEAHRRADQSDTARSEALRASEQARAEKSLAEQRTQAVAEQLEDMRKQREQELNKMQDALSGIVPTRRTPNGMVVDLNASTFRFDFDKAEIRPENRELLSRIAGILLASHGYGLYVYGYTDDVGTDAYNLDLSERRAKAVRDYLVESGISPSLLTHKGFGKSNPRNQNTTAQAREMNRRVEIGIIDTVIRYEGEARSNN